jgi:hypothetical protein
MNRFINEIHTLNRIPHIKGYLFFRYLIDSDLSRKGDLLVDIRKNTEPPASSPLKPSDSTKNQSVLFCSFPSAATTLSNKNRNTLSYRYVAIKWIKGVKAFEKIVKGKKITMHTSVKVI